MTFHQQLGAAADEFDHGTANPADFDVEITSNVTDHYEGVALADLEAEDVSASLQWIIEAARKSPCHPDNGGIGGLLPYCRACGAMTPPQYGCDLRPGCVEQLFGSGTSGVGFPD